MSTYFKVINLNKKKRGLLALHITNEQAEELITQRREAGIEEERVCHISFKKTQNGTWVHELSGYMNYLNKEEAGAVFMHACGDLWGKKGEWYGDKVVIICDGFGSDSGLFEASTDWPKQFFHIAYEDFSWRHKEYIEQLDQDIQHRKEATASLASTALTATPLEQNVAQGHSPECSSSTALGSGSIAGGSKNVAIGKTTPGVSIGLSWN